MKVFAAQLHPVGGDIATNIAKHRQLIDRAEHLGADVIFFPELSLTGFEPSRGPQLAMTADDTSLSRFQTASNRSGMVIGVGLPLQAGHSVRIGMAWFSPDAPVQTYAKQRLHSDEFAVFEAGDTQLILPLAGERLAPGICYESMQPEHAAHAASLGATLYLASVADKAGDVERAMQHFPQVAREHRMPVMFSNSLGPCEEFVCDGRSAAWDSDGRLLAQMDNQSEGGVLLDTHLGRATAHRP